MNDKKYCVYVHIFPNGKKYFGITCKEPKKRWQNGTGYSKEHQPVIYHAIQKYGWDNIEHKILYSGLTHEEANQKEMELIQLYKTNCHKYGDDYGYNMTDGGDGAKGVSHTDEAKEAIRQRMLGRTKELCPNSVPVICDGIEYPSIGDFVEKNNITEGAVSAWLMGIKGMPKKWYDKGLRYKDRDEYQPFCQQHNWRYTIIYNGVEYHSQKDVAEVIGVSPSTVHNWLVGKRAIPQEIYERGFMRVDGETRITSTYIRIEPIYYDGKYFKSQARLAEYMGVKKGTLWAWLHSKNKIPQKYKDKGLKAYK